MPYFFERRTVIKSLACISALAATPSFLTCAYAANEKPLLLYFSRSGNTRKLAQMITTRVQADSLELTPLKPYPDAYQACVDQAKKEQKENARPKLSNDLSLLDNYQIIFLGYPNWWGTMPMFFFTMLEAHPMAGKTIIPFCTHGGSQFGNSIRDLKKLCPKAKIAKGLAIPGTDVGSSERKVAAWLSELGLASKS